MVNNWQFIGKVVHVSSKPAGKATVTTLVLKRWDDTAKEKERESTCVCESWHATVPAQGDIVVAYGEMTGREYQGRWFGALRVIKWHYVAVAQAAPPPAMTPHTDAKVNGYQPQPTTQQNDTPF
jgi:hypothetical protein